PCASDSSNVHRWSLPSPPESVASNRRPPGIGWYGDRPALCWDKESGFPEGEVTGVHNPDVKLPPFSTEPSQYTDPSGAIRSLELKIEMSVFVVHSSLPFGSSAHTRSVVSPCDGNSGTYER